MGQQCNSNSTVQSYDLGKQQGIKIKGNHQSIYKPSKSSVAHFQTNKNSTRLNPIVQQIQSSLGNFQHSPSFIPPKGSIQHDSYKLNQQNLIYRQNGQWKNGMPHGRGQLIYPDGSYYVGYMYNGIPHGEGRFISVDGWYYEGQLQNQQAEGKGKFVCPKSGMQYVGNWAGDLPDGIGKQTWKKPNFTTYYQGQFLNGIKHGNAKYVTSQFNYEGRFQNNLPHGKGRMIYRNGQIYQGDFVSGRKHGYGLYTWPDHSTFQGKYVDDKKNGLGRFTSPSGKIFQGQWKNGKRQGQGLIVSNNKKHYYDWKNNEASPTKKKL